jgi:pectate lyase
MKQSVLALLAVVIVAAAAAAQPAVPVFHGARGFGIETPAGRGGRVVRVTSLDARGPGSFAAALESEGPRIVVFEVGGVIDLGRRTIDVTEPYLTVAGQTAPSPGVTVIRGGIRIRTHDVLIQHIRVRPGDAGAPRRSGWEPDGISAWEESAYNIVIDHCSVSWAVDENMSVSGSLRRGREGTARNVTFSNCIIAEGLHDSSHRKGPHSMGSLIHNFCSNVAIIGNLYAHNHDRNPYFKADATGVVVNNVIYNPGVAAVALGYLASEYRGLAAGPSNARVAVVGNVLLRGPDTRPGLPLLKGRGDAYYDDNIAWSRSGDDAVDVSRGPTILGNRPLWPPGLDPLPARQVLEHVLRRSGARPMDRDAVDVRIVGSVRSGSGCIIDSQDDVGGYPEVEAVYRRLEVPEDGIDGWLRELAGDLEGHGHR